MNRSCDRNLIATPFPAPRPRRDRYNSPAFHRQRARQRPHPVV